MSFFDKINRAKQGADSLLDPFLVLAGYNMATLEGTYRLIEDGDPLKVAAGVLGGGLALTWGNKALFKGIGQIPGVLPKLKDRALEAYNAGKSANLANWAKTATLVGALGWGLHNAEITSPREEDSGMIFNRKTEAVLDIAPLEDIVEARETPLLGKTVLPGTLYSYYTGINSIFEDTSELTSNKEVLTQLWDRKFENYSKTGAKTHLYEEAVIKFEEATNHRISLVDYITEFNGIIQEINQNMDWEGMKRRHLWGVPEMPDGEAPTEAEITAHLDLKLKLLKDLTSRITAEDIVSIAMKELFPPSEGEFDGEYKAEVLDLIYSVRGKQFADLIPSLNDNLASISPYQLTSKVVNGVTNNGASGMNQYVPAEMRIPGSIIELEGWDIERATYMNFIAGLTDALSRTDDHTLDLMENMNDEDFHLYLGGLHHRPADTRQAIKYWADNDAKFPLIRSMNDRLTNYNVQVRDNAIGLEAYLSNQASVSQ